MFYWGYDNYMTHAFPFDELDPIECLGRGHDWKNPLVNIATFGDFCIKLSPPPPSHLSLSLPPFLSLSHPLSLPSFSPFIRANLNINDALGDYSLTLVDVLDTLSVSAADCTNNIIHTDMHVHVHVSVSYF